MKTTPQKAWLRSSPERRRPGRRAPVAVGELGESEAGGGIKNLGRARGGQGRVETNNDQWWLGVKNFFRKFFRAGVGEGWRVLEGVVVRCLDPGGRWCFGAAGVADDELEGKGVLSAIDFLLLHESDGGFGEEL